MFSVLLFKKPLHKVNSASSVGLKAKYLLLMSQMQQTESDPKTTNTYQCLGKTLWAKTVLQIEY